MKNKKYRVVYRYVIAGWCGVELELSSHSTRPAAFRALHKYAKDYNISQLSVIDVETGFEQLETKVKDSKGRWRTI